MDTTNTNIGDIVFVTTLHRNAPIKAKEQYENHVYRVETVRGAGDGLCVNGEITVKNCPYYVREWIKLADSVNVQGCGK